MIWPILAALGNAVKTPYKLVLTCSADIPQHVDMAMSQQSQEHPTIKGSKFQGGNEAVIPHSCRKSQWGDQKLTYILLQAEVRHESVPFEVISVTAKGSFIVKRWSVPFFFGIDINVTRISLCWQQLEIWCQSKVMNLMEVCHQMLSKALRDSLDLDKRKNILKWGINCMQNWSCIP